MPDTTPKPPPLGAPLREHLAYARERQRHHQDRAEALLDAAEQDGFASTQAAFAQRAQAHATMAAVFGQQILAYISAPVRTGVDHQ